MQLSRLPRGSLLRTITGLAVPVVVANLSQTLMGLVDTLMVGRLGHVPLAAVGVATLLFSAVATSLKSVDVAAQTFAARRVGEGRLPEVGRILETALGTVLAAGLVAGAAGLLWPEFLMGLVSRDPEVRRLGADYLTWRFLGLLPLLVFFVVRGVFDGIGSTRVGMVVGIGMNLVNVGLNWVLIFGRLGLPAMGSSGAALASSLSGLLAAATIVAIALRPRIRRRYRLLGRRNLDRKLLRPFLAVAWPPALQSLGVISALLLFFFVLGQISTLAVATGNVVLRIAALSLMPGFGVGVAVQTLVGQSLGRRDRRGAVRAGWGGVAVSVVFMGAFGLLFLGVPGFLLRLFADSPELVAAGVPILRLMGLVQVVDAVGLTLAGALRGAGATRTVMIVDIVTGFCLLPPCAYLFGVAMGGGLLGAWIALLLWFSLYAVGMTLWFVKGDWQRVRV